MNDAPVDPVWPWRQELPPWGRSGQERQYGSQSFTEESNNLRRSAGAKCWGTLPYLAFAEMSGILSPRCRSTFFHLHSLLVSPTSLPKGSRSACAEPTMIAVTEGDIFRDLLMNFDMNTFVPSSSSTAVPSPVQIHLPLTSALAPALVDSPIPVSPLPSKSDITANSFQNVPSRRYSSAMI